MARTDRTTVATKIRRLRKGRQPRVLDLFAGCGGLSLGFQRAGFEIFGSVESDADAAMSHALNLHKGVPLELREAHSIARDIAVSDPEELVTDLGHRGSPELAVDVVVGGPPCQAFARVGRAKLREIAEHPRAFKQDPRGNLYLRYLEYVRQLMPLALMMENVPDVLNYGGHNIAEEMCETLDGLGYSCRYTLLNAVHYGVPEMRQRMFLVGYRKEFNVIPRFPAPTHRWDLPRGYESSRQVALRTIRNDLFADDSYYVDPPIPKAELRRTAVTANEALADLPIIKTHLNGGSKRGVRNPDDAVNYPAARSLSDYAKEMRTWPGFETNGEVTGHVIRHLPRDYSIFKLMNPGDQYPEAFRHATGAFEKELETQRKNGERIRVGSKRYESLKKSIVPPYDPSKFPNKWRKMEADAPARTLMAHLGKDSYSHIHYDSSQARTISVREAARLQSFPDGFMFSGTMNPAFRQIGNAVPPLLAYALALEIASTLEKE